MLGKTKKSKRIQLGRETLKVLSTDKLGQVHGGWWTKGYGECSSDQLTHCPCVVSDDYGTCWGCDTTSC